MYPINKTVVKKRKNRLKVLLINRCPFHHYNIPLKLVNEIWSNKKTQIISADIDPMTIQSFGARNLQDCFIEPAEKLLQDSATKDQNYYKNYLNYKEGIEMRRFLTKCCIIETLDNLNYFNHPLILYHRGQNVAFKREKNSLIIPGGNRLDIALLLNWPLIRCLVIVNDEDYDTLPWTLNNCKKYSFDEYCSQYTDHNYLLFDDLVVPYRNSQDNWNNRLLEFSEALWKKLQAMRWWSNLPIHKDLVKNADINTITTFPKINKKDVNSFKNHALLLLSLFCNNDYIFKEYKTFTLHKDNHPESWRKILKKISKVPYAY